MLTKDLMNKLPNCTLLSTVKQEEDEAAWLAARTRGIGGSDIGAIMGVSPFTSAKQIYFKKTGQYDDVMTPNEASKERMKFGHLLEPIVADEYAQRTGSRLIDINCTLAHKDYPWALANIDRLIVDDNDEPIGILECKTTGEYNNDEWDAGEILESYRYQLNWYMGILGITKGAFACLVGGNKFYYYDIFFDEGLFQMQIDAGKAFWFHNVAKLLEPEMQAGDSDLAKELYTDVIKGSEVVLDDDVANDLLATIVDCKKQIKAIEKIKDEAENRIKDRLKNAEIGLSKDFVVKWSPQSQQRVDTDKLKMVYPEIYDAVKKRVDFRKMTIKGGID